MSEVQVWCDGSSTGRANREWGFGFVIVVNDEVVCCGWGGGLKGSNNTAELTAAIKGIEKYVELEKSNPDWPCNVVLISDSMYCLGMASGQYNPSKNIELATKLEKLYSTYCTSTRHVKGHSGNHLNDRCDALAKRGKEEAKIPVKDVSKDQSS